MRVAIVGSGISGLSALWLLKQHSSHEVNIYDKDWRPGGQFQSAELRRQRAMLGGCLGHDPATSPNFNLFLKLLAISIQDSNFKLEENPTQAKANSSREGTWNLSFEVSRFKLLAPTAPDVTLGDYLKKEGYSTAFFEEYLLPRIAQKWLVPDDLTALSLPLSQVLELQAPTHTIDGGAKAVVDTICSIIPPENLHLNTEIVSVESLPNGVALNEAGGRRHIYDHVILAVPGDVALEMLKRGGRATSFEEHLLTKMDLKPISVAVLQAKTIPETDRKGTVEYSTTSAPPSYDGNGQSHQQVSLSYDMTAIDHLEEDIGQVNVVLNGSESGIYHFDYRVPLPKIQTTVAEETTTDEGEDEGQRHISLLPNQGRVESNLIAAYTLVTSEPFNANQPFPLIVKPRKPPTTSLRVTRSAVRFVNWVRCWVSYWVGFHVKGWNGIVGGVWRTILRVFGRS